MVCTVELVEAPNFPPHGNFPLFFRTSLLTSERTVVIQKSKENESFRTRLDVQNWLYSFFFFDRIHLKELRLFKENMESFHEVES